MIAGTFVRLPGGIALGADALDYSAFTLKGVRGLALASNARRAMTPARRRELLEMTETGRAVLREESRKA